jgi:hypothetical protein
MRQFIVFAAACACWFPGALWAQCGGEERWAVKMAADLGAGQIDFQNPVATTLHDLVSLPRPTLPSDDETRTAAERTVRVIEGRLVKFKHETGKTGDSDFHLVISDETLLFSLGGAGTQPSPHSVIAEIPDPACVAGRQGSVTTPSRFAAQLDTVRTRFMQRFPNITSGWNDAQGIPVRLTGIGFFDRAHGQVGRALNGLELHPLLAIDFTAGPPPPVAVCANPGFEDMPAGWNASADVITTNPNQPAHSGQGKAWLGGFGTAHTDRLWQRVALPDSAHAISLTFFLHVDSEEGNQQAFDKLRVRIRDANGQLLQTLKTFSNLQAAPGYTLQSLDLTAFKGRTIRIELEASEDNGSITSFVVDDFAVVLEMP